MPKAKTKSKTKTKGYPIFGTSMERDLYDPDELLDLFLDSTPDGVAIVNMENRFIRINHVYTQIFGFTEEDILGRSFEELPNPGETLAIIKLVKLGKAYTNIIRQLYHKDGNVLDIAVSYSPFRNTTGKIIAIIAIFRDMTELIRMERELKRTRELYELITENTTEMIKVYSKNKKVLYASPSHLKGIGIPPEELLGKSVYDLIVPEEKDHFNKVYNKLKETGEPQLMQVKLKTIDSSILLAESSFSPIYDENQEFDSFVSVARDITERKKNEAALRNLDRLSIIGQLAAGVAHEIRNPLTSLKGFSKLLKNTADKDKQEDYIEIIMNELDRIDMIVNEFMSLAKPQAILFEKENLISILDSTANVLHPQALLHNVQIKLDYPIYDINLMCSPNQLKQVFVNFLKNAIEAMPKGGTVLIDVQKEENNKVRINFTDEGIGIDTGVLKYLGTPFYTTKDKGIGLGLTISNKIIQEHGGTMKIDSKIGIGTTVTVELQCL